MDGITIIETLEPASSFIGDGVLWGMFGLAGFIVGSCFFVAGLIYAAVESEYWMPLLGAIVLCLGISCTCVAEHNLVETPQYRVQLSEDINYTEFYEKYEIVDSDSLTYIIKEKQNDWSGSS